MKRNLILRTAAVLAAMSAIVGCHKRIDETPDMTGMIGISADITTKGSVVTTQNIAQFGVFGYRQGNQLWDDVSSTATSDLMYNIRVNREATGWVYENPIPWPSSVTEYYAFFGYAPIASSTNGLTFLTDQSTPGFQRLSYQTMANVKEQLDLIFSSTINRPRNPPIVNMKFNHALTRVGFCATTNLVGTSVNWIKIAGVQYKGEVDVNRVISWTNVSADTTSFKVEHTTPITVDPTADKVTDLNTNSSYFMLLPQDLSLNEDEQISITVNYNQNKTQFEKSYTIKQNYESGKAVLYKLDLTGNPNADLIVSEVIITDWAIASMDDMDINDGVANPKVYTVTYDANGGSGVPDPVKVPKNQGFAIGAAPTGAPDSKQVFIGYNTSADGSGSSYQPGRDFPLVADAADLTLYALWTTPITIGNAEWTVGSLIRAGENGARVGEPTDGGLYFQFGSLIGWDGGASGDGRGIASSSNALAIQIKPSGYSGDTGYTACGYYSEGTSGGLPTSDVATTGIGDPCRYYLGSPWRTPTSAEFLAVANYGGFTENDSGNYGRWFGPTSGHSSSNAIWFPASGLRRTDGSMDYVGGNGYYWSESVNNADFGYYLYFGSVAVNPQSAYSRRFGYPVRCVKGVSFAIDKTAPGETIPDGGKSYTVQVTAGEAWTTTPTAGVTVSPSSGTGSTTVTITVGENPSTITRAMSVDFEVGGAKKATWSGTQDKAPFITINGTKWTNGNLVADGANGAKVGAPTDGGLYFQFGSLIGWKGGASGDGTGIASKSNALAIQIRPSGYSGGTGYTTCGYYAGGAAGSSLPAADDVAAGIGDPCRTYLGSPWRLPTSAEFLAVANYGGFTENGTGNNGRWFGPTSNWSSSNAIWLPASGYRHNSNGSFYGMGSDGYCWSESVYDADGGHFLYFGSSSINPQGANYRRGGFPVRCVQ